MKIKLFILIAFFNSIALVNAQTTQYEWDYVSSLQNEWLEKICTQGLDTVYIVGQNGLIAKSTDRALTWNKQYPVTTQLNDIIFCNHTTGFAVGNNGTILGTIDAGVNWTALNSGVTVNLNAITATGLDNIWAVGDSGLVIYSNDSGNNWHVKDLAITKKLNDLSFRNNTGYIVGDTATLFKTIDSGLSWAKDTLSNNNNIFINNFYSVVQTNHHSFVLNGSQLHGGLPIYINESSDYYSQYLFSSFTFVNDSVGYGVFAALFTGADEMILIANTLDGKSWGDYSRTFNFSQSINSEHSDISIVNDTIGYVITGEVLLKIFVPTIDGIENCKLQKQIIILQNNKNELLIKSASKPISSVELLTISGSVIFNKKWNDFQSEKSIDINGLPKGMYLVNSTFLDKSSCITKWIKQ